MTPAGFRAAIRDIEKHTEGGPYTLSIVTRTGQLLRGLTWSKVEGDDTVIQIGSYQYIALSFIERLWRGD